MVCLDVPMAVAFHRNWFVIVLMTAAIGQMNLYLAEIATCFTVTMDTTLHSSTSATAGMTVVMVQMSTAQPQIAQRLDHPLL
jgi:hypothetical protein